MLVALIADEGSPDVVEIQDYEALAHGFLKHRLMHAEEAWPRVILTAHRPRLHCIVTDDDSPHDHSAAFLGDAERWCYAAADAVFSPCRFILEPLSQLGFSVTSAEVVFNPYSASNEAGRSALAAEALELTRLLHTPAEPVLCFAKLQAQKGATDLLAALDALHTEGEAPPLWLFGRDAFLSGTPTTAYDAVERRHRRLFASKHVRYFGGYGPVDIERLCPEHPVVALPFREDCLPYAFIEAVMAGGLPLTHARGGQLELVPEHLRGRLSADATRPDLWADQARSLLALGPADRAALSRELKAAVSLHTDPKAVFARKIALLAKVRPTYDSADYPFAHPSPPACGPSGPDRRRALADAISLRGSVREVQRAGPALQPRPDLVSVVVPYYEMQAFIGETLASLEAQEHPALEVILVDDGSPTPAARRALEALAAAPRRFPTMVVRKTNGGLADARNAGAKLARGAFLYFLDADDLIHPSLIARSLRLLQRFGNVGYVGAGLKEFGDTDGEWTVHDVDGAYIGFHNLQICAFLARAELWLEHGFNDPRMDRGMEDYESHVRMFAAGVRGIAIPEPLFHYRKRAGSMSRGFEPHVQAYLYRRILRNSPDLFRRFGPELVGMHAENGHGALAPSPGLETGHHRQLFARDIPDRSEVEDETRASRERLGRALRGRCWEGGAEWDYTVARTLFALDHQPAFARQLLRGALQSVPTNGWFRLYLILATLRDGRLGEADTLWDDGFNDFCRAEEGSIGWIAGLEAVRGFPHVALALQRWLQVRAEVDIAAPPLHLGRPAETGGPFADLHLNLAELLAAREGSRAAGRIEDALRVGASGRLSLEAVDALLARWRMTWSDAGLIAGGKERAATFWGRTAGAYLNPARTPAPSAAESSDRAGWAALGGAEPLGRVVAVGRRLRRRLATAD
jgi:glycogen synthase